MNKLLSKAGICGLLVLLAVAAPAHAALIRSGENVTIPKEELVAENIYLAGGTATVSTVVQKDLVVAGGKVLVNGQVYGDILGAGGTVDILEPVRGDVRVAGGQVVIHASVGGDVVVAGGTVTIHPGAVVAGDLLVAGGSVVVDGTVSGETEVYGGEVTVNGVLAGPASIMAGKKLTFGDKARLGSSLKYSAPEEATVAEGAVLGTEVVYTPIAVPEANDLKAILFAVVTALFVIKLVATLLTSVVVVSVFTTFSQMIVRETVTRFWHMVLVGLGTTVLAPVLIVFLMLTVVGFYFALIIGAVYMLAMIFGGIYLCITTGAYIAKWWTKELRTNWKWTVLGTVVVFAVSLIPFFGWVAVGVVYLASVGALVTNQYRELKAKM